LAKRQLKKKTRSWNVFSTTAIFVGKKTGQAMNCVGVMAIFGMMMRQRF
jgi:hypothetical protein